MFLEVLLKDIDYCLKTRVSWLPALRLSSITIIEYLHGVGSSGGYFERWSRAIGDPGFKERFVRIVFSFPAETTVGIPMTL